MDRMSAVNRIKSVYLLSSKHSIDNMGHKMLDAILNY
uniref:Uncharacterized protein n=1 Tax=Rhizophora mucronata TaxID=61149 RepID=A0A2P2IV19_RHIMU